MRRSSLPACLRSGPAQRSPMSASRVSDDEDDYECPSVIHASGKPGYTIKYHQEVSASLRLRVVSRAHALKRPRRVSRAALRRPHRSVDSPSPPAAVRLLHAAALPAASRARGAPGSGLHQRLLGRSVGLVGQHHFPVGKQRANAVAGALQPLGMLWAVRVLRNERA